MISREDFLSVNSEGSTSQKYCGFKWNCNNLYFDPVRVTDPVRVGDPVRVPIFCTFDLN